MWPRPPWATIQRRSTLTALSKPEFIEKLLRASADEQGTFYTERLIGIWPTCALAHNNMGIYYASNRDDLKHAINHFTVAHRLEPDNEDFKTNMKAAKSGATAAAGTASAGLGIAGAVLTIGAMTYSAVSGNTAMSSADFATAGTSSYSDPTTPPRAPAHRKPPKPHPQKKTTKA